MLSKLKSLLSIELLKKSLFGEENWILLNPFLAVWISLLLFTEVRNADLFNCSRVYRTLYFFARVFMGIFLLF